MAKILLIAPTFFGYRDAVSEELANQGHVVSTFQDRPSEHVLFKSLGRISYSLVDKWIDAYADELISFVSSHSFDYIIYMGGMSFCFKKRQMEQIKEASNAFLVAYAWDSLANCQRLSYCLDVFDKVLSFDPADCKKERVQLRPLFYSAPFGLIPQYPNEGYEYDACFIGSVHQPEKFKSVLEISKSLKDNGLRVFDYFYMPSKSVEALRKLTDPVYRMAKFRYSPLSTKQIAEVYKKTAVVIDSPQVNQTGLTMRTLEALGARRKLITTNVDVANYDFYAYGDVLIWDGPASLDGDFFTRPYRELTSKVYDAYSIGGFCKSLIGNTSAYEGYDMDAF